MFEFLNIFICGILISLFFNLPIIILLFIKKILDKEDKNENKKIRY